MSSLLPFYLLCMCVQQHGRNSTSINSSTLLLITVFLSIVKADSQWLSIDESLKCSLPAPCGSPIVTQRFFFLDKRWQRFSGTLSPWWWLDVTFSKKTKNKTQTKAVAYLCPACYRCVWEVPARIPHWVGKHRVLYCEARWHLSAPPSLCRHSGYFSWSPGLQGPSQGQTHTQAYQWQNLAQ